MLKRLSLLAVVAVGLLVGAADLAAQGYQVLVNEANPTSSMTVEAVSQLFLKNTTRWAPKQMFSNLCTWNRD